MKDTRSIGVMILIVTFGLFTFWSGYAAGREGENRDPLGAILVAIAFISLCAGIWCSRFMWQKITDAPAGISARRYVLAAIGGMAVAIAVFTALVNESRSSDSFSLGVVTAVTVGVCCLVWRLISHSTPGQTHDENGSISFFEKEEEEVSS